MASAPVSRRINIYIDQASAERSAERLQKTFDRLTKTIKKGEAAGKDMSKEIAQISSVKKNLDEVTNAIAKGMAPTFRQMTAHVNELRRGLQGMSKDAPGYAAKFDEFKKAARNLEVLKLEIRGVENALADGKNKWSDFWRNAKAVAVGTIIGNTVQNAFEKLSGYFSGIISGNAKLSDSLANVKKATGGTTDEVLKLNKQIGKIDTRTANEQLREIAIGLGQMGEAATPEAIAAIDKIVVALGDEFGGGAKQITTELGKLRNNLQDFKTNNYGQDMLNLGNAINVMGASGLATGPVMVDFSKRISAVGGQFKLTTGQILGLSATMEELGIDVERGATGIIKIFQKIGAEPAKFAKVAGIPIKEFGALVNKDMVAAFNAVAVGAAKAGEKNTDFAKIIKELDTDGAGAGEVLSKFAANQELAADKIQLATKALKDQSSINDEFTTKNTNLAAKIEKLEKVFNRFVTSPFVNNFLTSAVDGATAFIGVLGNITGFIQKNIVAFTLWSVATAVQFGWVRSLVTWLGGLIGVTQGATAATILNTIATNASIVATSALGAAQALLTLNLRKFRQEWALMSAALGLNPFAAALIAIGAVVMAITSFSSKVKELNGTMAAQLEIQKRVQQATIEEEVKIKALVKAINNNNISNDAKKKLLNELIAINPEYLSGLNLANVATEEGTKLLDTYVQSLRNRAKEEALFQLNIEGIKEEAKLMSEVIKLSKQRNDIYKGDTRADRRAQAGDAIKTLIPGIKTVGQELAEAQRLLKEKQAFNKEVAKEYEKSVLNKAVADTKSPASKDYTYTPDGDKKLNDLAERRAEFLRKIAALNAEAAAASISEDEKELQRVRNKYAELNAEAEKLFADHRKYAKLYSDLTKAELRELDNLYKKHFENRSAVEYEDTLAKTKAYFDKERQLADEHYLAGIVSKQQYNDILLSLEEQEYNARAIVAQDYSENVKKAENDLEKFKEQASARRVAISERERKRLAEQQLADAELKVATSPIGSGSELAAQKALLEKRFELETAQMDRTSSMYLTKQAELNRALVELELQHSIRKIDNNVQIAQELNNIYQSFVAGNIQTQEAELENDRIANDRKKENLQRQLEKKKISENTYKRETAKADEEFAKKEHALKVKKFNAEKRAKLIEGGINLASAISKIIAVHAANPAAIPVLSILATTANAVQMAFIAAQKAPKFSKGRRAPIGNGGVPDGPSHTSGGIELINNRTGASVGQMEGNEPILSANTYINNKPLVDALLDSSMYKNGAPIAPKWFYTSPTPLNYRAASTAMESRYFAKGRSTDTNSSHTYSVSMPPDFIEAMNAFVAQSKDGFRAFIPWQDIRDKQQEYDWLKKAGSRKV